MGNRRGGAFSMGNTYPQRDHRRIAHFVIGRVDQNLVEDLVQPWHEAHLPLHELVRGLVINPRKRLGFLTRPDVRIGPQKDVLQLCFLLVNLLHGLTGRLAPWGPLGGGVACIAEGRFLGLGRSGLGGTVGRTRGVSALNQGATRCVTRRISRDEGKKRCLAVSWLSSWSRRDADAPWRRRRGSRWARNRHPPW